MPEYLAPGVFVEETSYRSKSIQGVGTSVAGIVGPTRKGPLRGTPEVATSFGDFVRVYGDAKPLVFDGEEVLNYTALAAKAFFDNGGKQLYVARIANGVNSTDENGTGSTATFATRTDTNSKLILASRFPGVLGQYALELRWRDSENLLNFKSTTVPKIDELLFFSANYTVVSELPDDTTITENDLPITVKAVVKFDGTDLIIQEGNVTDQADTNVAAKLGTLKLDKPPKKNNLTRAIVNTPMSGAIADGAHAQISLTEASDISAYTGVQGWGSLTTILGTFGNILTDNPQFIIEADLNEGVGSDITISLAALAGITDASTSIIVQRNFDLDVRVGGINGEIIYSINDISTSSTGNNTLEKRLAAEPSTSDAKRTQPVSAIFSNAVVSGDIFTALFDLFDDQAKNGEYSPINEPRYIIQLNTGGSDGEEPVASDYRGEVDEIKGNTGLASFEQIEDISIVATPAAAAHKTSHQAVVAEVQAHCSRMRYRIGIVDSQQNMSIADVRTFASNFDSSRLALYYPWVVMSDPTGETTEVTVPPGGFIAGVYAGTDVRRGVHKPPANEIVIGALRFGQEINTFQQELLNPNGINCLRSFSGRGHRVWGGRTLASDSEWKYVNVRRYFLYLERSIEKSSQWIVFEPNGDILWRNVRNTIENFLYNEWFNGRLLGSKASEAYFVRCDRSTMTQADLDEGRLVCEIGVAALKPAEFVIFRIGQKTADI